MPPPGGKSPMKRMGPVGQLPCALTMAGAASNPAPRPKVVRRVMVFFMLILPVIDRAMQRGLWRHGNALWVGSQEELEAASRRPRWQGG